MSSPAARKALTDRISMFEQKKPQSPNVSSTSVPTKHYPAKRTLSSKNVHTLKSQFDKSGDMKLLTSQESIIQETSPPPPPPPRTLPPESPPQVPKRISVTSKPTKKPTVSPPSSGKASPTGGSAKTTTAGRKSPPGSKTGLNKTTAPSKTQATPTKKKPVSNSPSPTTPIPKNVGGINNGKKVASRTTSSPISPQPQHNISLEKSGSVAAQTMQQQQQQPVSKMTSSHSSTTVKKASLIQQNQTSSDHKNNNNSKIITDHSSSNLCAVADSNNQHVPIIEVSLETPSATSTPNLNSKKNSVQTTTKTDTSVLENPIEHVKSKSPDTSDLVVNKNFINEAVTGSRYWTNQALQNDNSTKISQVVRADFSNNFFFHSCNLIGSSRYWYIVLLYCFFFHLIQICRARHM